jgi:hypothetical protein
MGVSGQRHAPAALYPRRKDPGTHWTGGWVGLRAGLDTEARGKILSPLPRIEPPSPGRPGRSQTLYCLSYPAPWIRSQQQALDCARAGEVAATSRRSRYQGNVKARDKERQKARTECCWWPWPALQPCDLPQHRTCHTTRGNCSSDSKTSQEIIPGCKSI